MIRSLFYLTALLFGVASSQNYNDNSFGDQYFPQAQHITQLVYVDKTLSCGVVSVNKNEQGRFSGEDCSMFLYVNNKRVAYQLGMSIQYKYKSLVISKVRCEAQCENELYKDRNITPSLIEINRTIFIGLCSGAGVAFLLLIVAIICGVRHCRGHYYKKVKDEGEPMNLEKHTPLSPVPTAPPKSALDAELATEVRKKKISESSESSSDEDNVDGNMYNYNPNSKYNYAEMTSEI